MLQRLLFSSKALLCALERPLTALCRPHLQTLGNGCVFLGAAGLSLPSCHHRYDIPSTRTCLPHRFQQRLPAPIHHHSPPEAPYCALSRSSRWYFREGALTALRAGCPQMSTVPASSAAGHNGGAHKPSLVLGPLRWCGWLRVVIASLLSLLFMAAGAR